VSDDLTAAAEERHGIMVGVDGGEPSIRALQWAAERTDRFGPVRPVHSWDYPLAVWAPSPFGPGAAPPFEEMEAAAREAASACLDTLEGVPHEEPLVFHGDAGPVLVEAARDAELLVVGTRGRGPVRSNVIGSVGRYCADHSPVPLVIVPCHESPVPSTPCERIVVGVDGSDHSMSALTWAVANAGDDAEIVAISSWQTPIDGPILYGVNRFDIRALKAAAKATVNETADKVCAALGVDPSRVAREIAEGDPRWVLMSRSESADLLVLGQRGRTGLPHFFLGSTTTALIHRPHCPTAVIPG
jgi:nucleotide-binding universal stress UspA family protein